jgi:hypothetical protein
MFMTESYSQTKVIKLGVGVSEIKGSVITLKSFSLPFMKFSLLNKAIKKQVHSERERERERERDRERERVEAER